MILRILEERKKRYDELHDLLADEKVVANQAEYQAYAKEMSALTPLINEYNSYRKILKDIDEMEKVLKEKGHDKEFMNMAEEELLSLKAMSK
ncbi:MAG: PCRF domain-containing protein, partial [Candidatus Omnitrophica bacterium]|nr:PCRF domain-containing protein [Candidatus Omnitrophota bacterium]